MSNRFFSATSPRALARLGGLCFCVLFAAGPLGCDSNKSSLASDQVPAVPVSKPIEKVITDTVDFTGRTDAVESVDIRARVTGYLMGMPFKEGGEVKAGELLFEIDHRPYKAQLDQALGQVTLTEASLTLARATYERDLAVARAIPGGTSQQQLDQDMAAVAEALARLNASRASTEIYKINVGFTKVASPINGQVSRYYLTKGNLVNQDQTLLTTVVSLKS
jgi:membrane fusion protein, multidrug efflux system